MLIIKQDSFKALLSGFIVIPKELITCQQTNKVEGDFETAQLT